MTHMFYCSTWPGFQKAPYFLLEALQDDHNLENSFLDFSGDFLDLLHYNLDTFET